MTLRLNRCVVVSTVFILFAAALAEALSLDQAITAAEGRRRAAENGVKAITAKSAGDDTAVKAAYEEAMSANNAWLDATVTAVKQGRVIDGAQPSATEAASTLVAWVAARNRALGEPILAGAVASAVETRTRQELIELTTQATRGNDKKRAATVQALESRLRWKAWGELK